MTVRQAFEQERERLLPLPQAEPSTDQTIPVKVGKTPYVRFDLNDYSVPHTRVRRTLTVVAGEKHVRVLDGLEEVASHERSYDKGKQVEDSAHLADLVEHKRRAKKGRATSRLVHAAPTTEKLLEELALRGENLGSLVNRFMQLLSTYGAERLERAAREALSRGAPHPRSVRLILERERIDQGRVPIIPVELPDDPKVRGISVRPHELSSYDGLTEKEEEPEEGKEEEDGQEQK